jgi:imidazolonepropionase
LDRPQVADLVVRHAGELLTCAEGATGGGGAGGEGDGAARLGLIADGALAVAGGRIVWVGRDAALAAAVTVTPATRVLDAAGRLVMPGLVECHTHVVFGGDRAAEYQLRVAGATYGEIAATGGGILSTVRATRAATFEELRRAGARRLRALLEYGVTTVEVKSGYGLTVADELRLLEVYAELARTGPQTLVPTLLGAHTVPPEYAGRADAYVDLVVGEMIPAAAERGLAVCCDVFVEEGAFTRAQARRVLEAGAAHGLRPKLHVDQLSPGGGAELAAELGALSADHLDHVSQAGIEALVAAGVVAVLLPGAVFFLGLREYAPARRLLDAGVRVALSTDCNPGTCNTENVFLMGTIASTQMGMRVDEVVRALTIEAAHAVGLAHDIGSLEPGKRADLVLLDATSHLSIPYHWGIDPVAVVVKDGQIVCERGDAASGPYGGRPVGMHEGGQP